MAVVLKRMEPALGVPPFESSGPSELFDSLRRSCGTRLGTVFSYPDPIPIISRLWWLRSSKGVLPYKPA